MEESFCDEYFDHCCTQCKRKKRNTEAKLYCPVCDIYLCQPCRAIHEEFTINHDVKDTTKLDLWGLPKQQEVEYCHLHHELDITIFCEQHEALCCALCSSEHHSTCENKVPVANLAKCIYQTQEMATTVGSIGRLKPQLTALIESLNVRQVSLDDSKTCFRATLQDYRDIVKSALEKQTKSASDKVETIYKRRNSVLESDVDKCDMLSTNVGDLQRNISNAEPKPDEIHLYLKMKSAQEIILMSKHRLTKMAQPDNFDIKWLENKTIINRIKQTSTLGQLHSIIAPRISRPIQRVSNLHAYNIRHNHDANTCDIQGICQLLDGTVILSDKANTNLKRLDLYYHVTEALYLESTPGDLCRTGRKEVAVAFYGQKMVQFVTVTDKIRVTQTLTFDLKCYKISWNDGILYIVNGWGDIYAYKITVNNGNKESEILKILSGNFVTHSLTLKADCDHIFIAGTSKELTIIVKKISTRTVSQTVHPDMSKPSYKHIGIDKYGNVLVSNYDTGSILLFKNQGQDANGKLNSDDDDFKDVNVILVDDFNNKLLVQRRGCDTIKALDIVYQ